MNNLHITPLGWTALVAGFLFYWLFTEYTEPWVIETLCRELVQCDRADK